jgi:hypothetical protein
MADSNMKRYAIMPVPNTAILTRKDGRDWVGSFIPGLYTTADQTQSKDKDHIEHFDGYRLATAGYLMGLELVVYSITS